MDRKDFTQLYALASTGKVKTWKIWVVKNADGTATIWTRHGYVDGNLQEKPKIIKVGKNIGRSNETSPFEQAVLQAKSTYQKKIDKNYMTNDTDIHDAVKILLPMLAHSWTERSHNIQFPAYVQPKFNGVRCMATKLDESTIQFRSRKGKSYDDTLVHLVEPLLKIMEKGEIWDGEIYVHGWGFQEILRRVKKLRDDSDQLEFHVYDIANTRDFYENRYASYMDAIEDCESDKIVAVQCEMITRAGEVETMHSNYAFQGYEGVIIRNLNGLYKFQHRSQDLQKYKHFETEEFPITGYGKEVVQVPDGAGGFIETNCVVWSCTTPEGKVFDVRPRGTTAQRKQWYNEAVNIVGKKELTVRYQEKSEDLIPIFPVGIAIRDYE
jgi:DNA ligase-1